MTDQDRKRVRLKTPRCRLSFPHLFKPQANTQRPTDPPKYNCVLLFDAEAQKDPRFQALKEAVARVAREKWGQKLPAKCRFPFRDGAEKEYDGYGAGVVFCSASSHRPPECLTPEKENAKESDLYPGCYVVALISPYAYDNGGNRGVALGLEAVMKVADGAVFGGGARSAREAFEDEEAPAATSHGPGAAVNDDDIPF